MMDARKRKTLFNCNSLIHATALCKYLRGMFALCLDGNLSVEECYNDRSRTTSFDLVIDEYMLQYSNTLQTVRGDVSGFAAGFSAGIEQGKLDGALEAKKLEADARAAKKETARCKAVEAMRESEDYRYTELIQLENLLRDFNSGLYPHMQAPKVRRHLKAYVNPALLSPPPTTQKSAIGGKKKVK
jgi:hypothetical protein